MNAQSQLARTKPLLTRGQLQLVERVARGESGGEIAAALGLGRNTVEQGLRRARERLGARTTSQLVAIAIARGLLDVAFIRAMADAADTLGIGARP